MRRTLAVLAVLAAVLCAAAAPARAATFETGMEDEGLLLSNPQLAPAAVIAWKRRSASTSSGSTRAGGRSRPPATATKAPSGFNAVQSQRRPLPLGHARHRGGDRARHGHARDAHDHRPRAAVGEQRAQAATTRAGSPRRRPTGPSRGPSRRATRTQVDRYLLWNEPNQQGWLQPQWQCNSKRRNCTPVAPHVYRSLVRAAEPQVHAADPGSEVVMGELAPIGDSPISANTPIKPLIFMREMGCVDAQYRTIRTGLLQGLQGGQVRLLRLPPAPAAQRAGQGQSRPGRGAVRRPLAALPRARQAARRRSAC